jgi:hypothetical protein
MMMMMMITRIGYHHHLRNIKFIFSTLTNYLAKIKYL